MLQIYDQWRANLNPDLDLNLDLATLIWIGFEALCLMKGIFVIKGAVIIYGWGGWCKSENCAHSKFTPPPSMTAHYVFAPP